MMAAEYNIILATLVTLYSSVSAEFLFYDCISTKPVGCYIIGVKLSEMKVLAKRVEEPLNFKVLL